MVVVIAGPTASGKSALALQLAERHGGLVINADALQVYRDLRILTARPSPDDESVVPHALYGHLDASAAHSVAAYLSAAADAITAADAAGRMPIVVGGTGLYLSALTEGLSQVPPVPDDIRDHWRTQQGAMDAADLYDTLAARDRLMAQRLRPSDTQRIVRALEVLDATGRSLAQWQGERVPGPLADRRTVTLLIAPDRAALHARIDARFAQIMESGGVEEAAALAGRGLDPSLPAMKAIGLRELASYARGQIGRSQALERGAAQTRQYAKRQETWFRNRLTDALKVAGPREGLAALKAAALPLAPT